MVIRVRGLVTLGVYGLEKALGSLLRDVVEILYVGIWGPGYMYIKGCKNVSSSLPHVL